MKLRGHIILLLLLIGTPGVINGQEYRLELGVTGGSSSYMGEANTSDPFYQPRSMVGIMGRYNISGNMALRANVATIGLSGDTYGRAAQFPAGEEVRFRHRIMNADILFELGFSQYGVASYRPGSSIFCPYLAFGMGLTGYKTNKQQVAFHLPFGFGFKVKVLPRVNAGCEWLFYKTSTDNLDYVTSTSGFQLNNEWAGSDSWQKNKDWYSALKLTITLDLWGTGPECYR